MEMFSLGSASQTHGPRPKTGPDQVAAHAPNDRSENAFRLIGDLVQTAPAPPRDDEHLRQRLAALREERFPKIAGLIEQVCLRKTPECLSAAASSAHGDQASAFADEIENARRVHEAFTKKAMLLPVQIERNPGTENVDEFFKRARPTSQIDGSYFSAGSLHIREDDFAHFESLFKKWEALDAVTCRNTLRALELSHMPLRLKIDEKEFSGVQNGMVYGPDGAKEYSNTIVLRKNDGLLFRNGAICFDEMQTLVHEINHVLHSMYSHATFDEMYINRSYERDDAPLGDFRHDPALHAMSNLEEGRVIFGYDETLAQRMGRLGRAAHSGFDEGGASGGTLAPNEGGGYVLRLMDQENTVPYHLPFAHELHADVVSVKDNDIALRTPQNGVLHLNPWEMIPGTVNVSAKDHMRSIESHAKLALWTQRPVTVRNANGLFLDIA